MRPLGDSSTWEIYLSGPLTDFHAEKVPHSIRPSRGYSIDITKQKEKVKGATKGKKVGRTDVQL